MELSADPANVVRYKDNVVNAFPQDVHSSRNNLPPETTLDRASLWSGDELRRRFGLNEQDNGRTNMRGLGEGTDVLTCLGFALAKRLSVISLAVTQTVKRRPP